ncbi:MULTISPECIES: phosphoribosylformylglycinamidine synthase subunit PurL [unclassified Mucilaginibacter]|uniref:phosphoribosylformylglycinamidine synthase subunit PurL n=1 Tax=unclassified Mucilaginibacter TaxID=2617802 RepID=UPI002AC9A536|nr:MULTISPECIES: phosphoribosylformylglycinamidine synthase subunit PurL [unclassified Mucilaginibacter]MEB0248796.1 phosphoribosylformylglycinamidine synthase subunit PurL [Mucilaginibacter sp. 5B2]MEB0261278.1 phosphoribosylformylglycinamidine synthase subunit PurL [Mucilaginibacter sp. 10I4]MEB0279102.1 phosphoribosylformylglycinamidine synthase subunit PurL [Mucilaginibacter sp. 10B2]MEB0299879.1 phosphoribosylformylglycinamidine synthase subunit PurL [Mucilaginibacter sp. 5C4]WPX22280.1 p
MENQELTTVETARDLGLLPEEYTRIQEIMGRVPNFTELSIFAVMWSEHCSYKNSITWLKTLPKDSPRMLAKAGEENAGLVDLGDGIGCAFKIESHNHPSALEPYQGAATGVGGINRDIFTMGARPIAQMNSLRFGDLSLDKTKWLVKGVVKGISHYGNAFGIPTVGGELFFDECYNINPLVNAFSAGIVKAGETVSATSYGVGNPVYIVGSATGKDGIHGAAFASKDITEDSINDLPAVQVGDPFQEKLLLEATLEVIKTGAVVGMQDMGAAGIICSNSEMSAKGEHGMIIHLDRVPMRQENMKPYEILLSESQERMLIVVEKGKEALVEAVFDKWDLNCAIIGEVTDTQRLEYFMNGVKVADVPADDLVLGGGAPVYEREYREPAYFAENQKFKIEDVAEPANLVDVAKHLIGHANLASKRWVTDQYDSMIGTATMTTNRPSDAAVVAVKDTDKAIVLTCDCNSRYVYADPQKGTAIAVAEAARNITCAGGEPVAITNCLNFGNPYKPEVYWQFVGAIKGMGEACIKFETPVTGGNVSFYNQSSDEGPVFPTPTIGMLGVMDDQSNLMTLDFKQPGDLIYMVGASHNDIASSQYLASYHKISKAPAPYFNIDEEYAMHQVVKELIKHKVVQSAHDVADGGLYIALVESAMPNGLGFDIESDSSVRKDAFLFGEAQGRVVVSVAPDDQERFIEMMATSEVEFSLLGSVNGTGNTNIDEELFGNITDIKMVHDNVLHVILGE